MADRTTVTGRASRRETQHSLRREGATSRRRQRTNASRFTSTQVHRDSVSTHVGRRHQSGRQLDSSGQSPERSRAGECQGSQGPGEVSGAILREIRGEVREWLNRAVSKTVEPSRAPWVRIPPSPPRPPQGMLSTEAAGLGLFSAPAMPTVLSRRLERASRHSQLVGAEPSRDAATKRVRLHVHDPVGRETSIYRAPTAVRLTNTTG